MAPAGFVLRFLNRCALAALMMVAAACGGGGDGGPPPAQPVSLAVTGVPAASMLPGESAQLAATLTYSDASTKDVTSTATWSTSNVAVLTVSSAGAIAAVAPGQAEVTASTQGLSARSTVRVVAPAPLARLALFAGSLGGPGTADGVGVDARFNSPTGVAADSGGSLYVGDRNNYTIRRIDTAGVVTTFAGSPGASGSVDGVGSDARFMQLWGGLAADGAGNVYVADNHTIRRITPGGIVSTWVGMPGVGGGADGSGAEARFGRVPRGLAIDRAGNLYVADTDNRTIRRITPAGVVSTLAGLAGVSGGADGVGSEARFASPRGIAADPLGNLYVADGHRIRKVTPAGVVSTLAGAEGQAGSADGPGTASRFNDPSGVATDSRGNIYVADSGNYAIRRIAPDGVVSTVAGTAGSRGSADGVGPAARFGGCRFAEGPPFCEGPLSVVTDAADNVYVTDSGNHTLRRITPATAVSTVAGAALEWGAEAGADSSARFGGCFELVMGAVYCLGPAHIAADGEGNLYLADQGTGIRKISPVGEVGAAIVGSGGEVSGIATDSAGNLYWPLGASIIKMTAAGDITTLAGSWQLGSTDGFGADARFYLPEDLATDSAGNLYVADSGNHTIRKITPAGMVTTIAGAPGQKGTADGIGPEARFSSPQGIVADREGNLYVTDNHAVRRISPSGVVTTSAGVAGQAGFADGTGPQARFDGLRGIDMDRDGNLYVADSNNYTVRKITPSGAVATVVGAARKSDFVPGSLPGSLKKPYGVAVVGTSLFISMDNGVAVVTNVR